MLLNTTPTLRHATQADWPAIEALLLANKLPTDGAQAHLNTYLLAVANGEVIGSAGAEVYGQIALLRSVAVAPGLHKQGIGRLLLDRMLLEAGRRDIGRRRIALLWTTLRLLVSQFEERAPWLTRHVSATKNELPSERWNVGRNVGRNETRAAKARVCLMVGGVDGARTRDPRRDRPVF